MVQEPLPVHQPLQLGSPARLTSDAQWLKGQKDLEKTEDYKKLVGGKQCASSRHHVVLTMARIPAPAAISVSTLPKERGKESEYMRLKPLLTHDLQDLTAAPASYPTLSLWPSTQPLASNAALQQDALPSQIVLDGFRSGWCRGVGETHMQQHNCIKQKAIYFSYRKK